MLVGRIEVSLGNLHLNLNWIYYYKLCRSVHILGWIDVLVLSIDVCNINGSGNTTNGGTIQSNVLPTRRDPELGVRKITETQSVITALGAAHC